MVYLITGRAGAGKTHYGRCLLEDLRMAGMRAKLFDSDDIRNQSGNQDYSDAGRLRNLQYLANWAAAEEAAGIEVIVAAIAPKRAWRLMMRRLWKQSRLIYIPGGKLWPGTTYEHPGADEWPGVTYMRPDGDEFADVIEAAP